MNKEIFNARMMFRLMRDFALIYLGVYGAYFFYNEVDYGSLVTNTVKIISVTLATLIYCRGVISLIQDIKNGAFGILRDKIAGWKLWKKVKSIFNDR